jgi:Uncharacterised nucleotidyltransferase
MSQPSTNSVMTTEDQLCLLLARGRLSPEMRARILELLATPLEWPQILERAYSHQVYPLLYRTLLDLGFPSVPVAVQSELKGLYLANALRNQLLAEELARLLGLLGVAGIRVIPLKGVTLACSLFGDSAARVCSDIDILVPAAEALRARRVILANGYASQFAEEFFAKHQLHTTAECSLISQTEPLTYLVELHWTLLQDSAKDEQAMTELWSQARPADFFGARAWQFTPEWQFLYLSFHAAYHKWNTLKWLADIHELCSSTPPDWKQVKQYAVQYELEAVADPTLAACSHLFDTPLPEEFRSASLPVDVRLFPDSEEPAESWKVTLFYPRLLKRRSEKLRWYAQNFFVPRLADYRFVRLPSSLTFLYYILRPLRLSFKWSWRFLRMGVARLSGSGLSS